MSSVSTYTAVSVMPVTNVGLLQAAKKVLVSPSFTCPDDPKPVSFKFGLGFGKGDHLEAYFYPVNRAVCINSFKFVVFDQNMSCLKSKSLKPEPEVASAGRGRGFGQPHALYKTIGVGNVDLRVLLEIVYEGVLETTKCICGCKCTKCGDEPTLLQTWSQNMLDLVSNPRNADVLFLVGKEKEKIGAHKDILSARSTYFRSLFEPSSNWKENQSD